MIVLSVLFLFLIILFGWFAWKQEELEEFVLYLGSFTVVGFGLSFISCLTAISEHSQDLAIVRTSQDIINVHQEAIEEVGRQMKEFPATGVSLMNNDSPYRSLIELRGHRINELSESKIIINRAKRKIIARKLGIMSRDIVWLFGDK